jgi:hypothetical protein
MCASSCLKFSSRRRDPSIVLPMPSVSQGVDRFDGPIVENGALQSWVVIHIGQWRSAHVKRAVFALRECCVSPFDLSASRSRDRTLGAIGAKRRPALLARARGWIESLIENL